jgi:RES domain-containing protein
MILWRISRHLDLSGTGGLWLRGRWHHIGNPVVDLATSPAAALLEVCVHTAADDIPPGFTLIKVSVPDDLTIARIDRSDLPADWVTHQNFTRGVGTSWLKANASALLEVPSALVPETINFLLNPLHPQASRCAIMGSQSYPFDSRLKV